MTLKDNKIIKSKLDLKKLTQFSKKVLYSLYYKVPKGKVISYSKLAEISGFKNSSRVIGSVMRKNPYPVIIPCHRVVKKDGSLGNYSYKGKNNPSKKKALLLKENIKFDKNDRIIDKYFL